MAADRIRSLSVCASARGQQHYQTVRKVQTAFCPTGKRVQDAQFARSLRSLRTKEGSRTQIVLVGKKYLRAADLNGGAAPA